jgi:methanogenic corrinoid protein MtbC1
MLADLVRQQGWEVSDLGADVPESSFVHAVLTTPDVVAVGISVTTAAHLPAAATTIAALHDSAPEVLLVVGGAAIRDQAHALALGADAAALDGRSFAELVGQGARAPGTDDHAGADRGSALAIEQVFD